MTKGILFGLIACFIWGLIFIIPTILSDFSAFEVVLGRYGTFGIFSCLLLFRKGFSFFKKYPLPVWKAALGFALIANILYYVGLVVGLRFASSALTVLVVGLAPLVIVFYSNFQTREISYRQLLLPSLWIFVGIICVNISKLDWTFSSYSLQEYLIGMGGILLALSCWSLYVVHNARFLQKNPQVDLGDWATILGLVTFLWVILVGVLFAYFGQLDLGRLTSWNADTLRFLVGSSMLGVLCSWLGCFLWNKTSCYLPVSALGPLSLFETIFGLLFVYSYEMRFPSLVEAFGIISMVGGTGVALFAVRKVEAPHRES